MSRWSRLLVMTVATVATNRLCHQRPAAHLPRGAARLGTATLLQRLAVGQKNTPNFTTTSQSAQGARLGRGCSSRWHEE